ncbi:MAG: LytTR family DNA-binding domain-containing protein [Lachnospiraceae bacterium]|nr:LytTR family DNA-binding domain-containing protein [Lachnospiraceae bacterium]
MVKYRKEETRGDNMRIALCDDDKMEQEQFIRALHGWDADRMPEIFTSGQELLEAAKVFPPFDIVFLDIYMPMENGVDVAKSLRKISPDSGIVFVTNSSGHAVEAFSVNALHYLVKPVTVNGIRESFLRLTTLRNSRRERSVLNISVGKDSYSLYMDEIRYIESANHATEILMQDGRIYRVWTSLNELSGKLDGNFLKVQRGIIVNMDYIEQMGMDSCILRDGTRLLLSRSDRLSIRTTYDNYAFSRLARMQDEKMGGYR